MFGCGLLKYGTCKWCKLFFNLGLFFLLSPSITGVPQGSWFGTLLIALYINLVCENLPLNSVFKQKMQLCFFLFCFFIFQVTLQNKVSLFCKLRGGSNLNVNLNAKRLTYTNGELLASKLFSLDLSRKDLIPARFGFFFIHS